MSKPSSSQMKVLVALSQPDERLSYANSTKGQRTYYRFSKIFGSVPYRTVMALVKQGLVETRSTGWNGHDIVITQKGRQLV